MTKEEYFFSILIPAWDAEKYIVNNITSILKNSYDRYKVIIIAGGNDKTLDLAYYLMKKYPKKVEVIEQILPNKNKALNIGLSKANGDIIVLTDVDCIYPNNWLSKLNEIFQNYNINVVTGHYISYQYQNNSLANYLDFVNGTYIINYKQGEIINGEKIWGGNTAFRRDIFLQKIGKFNEKIKTGTDKNLGIEFNKATEKVYFFRDIYLQTELYPNNICKFFKQNIRWKRNFLYSLKIKKKYFLQILLLIGASFFKIFYPFIIILIGYLFFNSLCSFLLFLPWLLFIFIKVISNIINLKKYSIEIENQLGIKINYKSAYKIVVFILFLDAVITLIAFLYPRNKWIKIKESKILFL